MDHKVQAGIRHKDKLFRYGIASLALAAAIAGAPAQGVAWADPTGSAMSAASASESESTSAAETGPARGGSTGRPDSDTPSIGREADDDATGEESDPDGSEADGSDREPDSDETPDNATDDIAEPSHSTGTTPAEPADAEPADPEDVVTEPDSDPQHDSPPQATPTRDNLTDSGPTAKHARAASREDYAAGREDKAASREDYAGSRAPGTAVATLTPPATQTDATQTAARVPALTAVTSPATVETSPAVGPLSPLAELLQLPGRLVNAVLQAFDITASANSPDTPINWAPINDLVFGAFRELERLLGLHRTPAPQPVVPTLTYTGPTDRPTPTVAQFINAAAAGYVLGSTPGGLVPFTVNGFQLSSTNIVSGMVGNAWATPEGQIIIAYQGTSGGTNLLFNPLITVSQVIADLQMVFTGTTPQAFYDAVDFAERVQAEAALQGYSADDIFVTGHSLGGWQAQFVAQQTGLAGIGFEAPGMNSVVPGNGADSMFVNIGTYGSLAPYLSTDLPGLQPFMPPYVPGGGSKPHYGPIVMVGDPAAMTPLYNASELWGKSLIGSVIFLVDCLGNFGQYHMVGVQGYHLDVTPDPGVTPWLGTVRGPVHTGYGTLTIPQLMAAASQDGILFRP